MLIDLLSTSNYISANIELVKLLGLPTAVYLNELININIKAVRKDKINDSFFIVDRYYLQDRTTISVEEQLNMDDNLKKIDILEKIDNDTIKINLDVITTIIMSSDESIYKDISSIINSKPKKKSKSEAIIENLKSNIVTSNQELKTAYSNWIDSVYAREGWMTKQAVISAQSLIDNYSNHDLDVALKLLEIASINGWRDIQWAINDFNKKYKNKFNSKQPVVQSMSNFNGKVFK